MSFLGFAILSKRKKKGLNTGKGNRGGAIYHLQEAGRTKRPPLGYTKEAGEIKHQR